MANLQEEILSLSRGICRPAEGEEALLGKLCAGAEAECRSWLRPEAAEEDCGERFPCACAFLAAADLMECRAGGPGGGGFTAGSVTVRAGAGAEGAGALRAAARRMLAPWTETDGFAFRGVRG